MSLTTSPCIVITGAAGALGSALVNHIAKGGARVAALVSPKPGAQEETSAGGSVLTIPMNLTSPEAWSSALKRIEGQLGAPSGAVLAAGAWQGGAPFHEADDAVWTAMMTANIDTARRSLRALLPGMVTRKAGSIVVIGSRAAERPSTGAGASAYTASKAAVVALAQAIAAEVLDHGVRVNAVLPSTIDTPANRRAMPDGDPSKWVSLDSLAGVIAFLLSDAARDISGAALPVYARS
jgi:NAD(P)-dependent dehydrogenase (short-subunit alcohol dehydrogenase family)